jgi:hypothetical protein
LGLQIASAVADGLGVQIPVEPMSDEEGTIH